MMQFNNLWPGRLATQRRRKQTAKFDFRLLITHRFNCITDVLDTERGCADRNVRLRFVSATKMNVLLFTYGLANFGFHMQLLYNIPLIALFLLIQALCLLVGLMGVWVVRRYNWMLDAKDNGTAALAHAFVGVLYAVALGLMVVGVQSGYSEVESLVMSEAYRAEDLYIDSKGLSGQGGREIGTQVKGYIDSVVNKEWPAIAIGESLDHDTQTIIENVIYQITSYETVSDHDLVVYAEVLGGANELLDYRRERLHLGGDGVGIVTWMVVIMGALITVGMAWVYNTVGAHAHFGLVGCMSAMFGLMIFLIVAMDHPLWGTFSVKSDPFKEVQRNIMHWEAKFDKSLIQ